MTAIDRHQYSGTGLVVPAIVLAIWNSPNKLEEIRKVLAKLVLRPMEIRYGDIHVKVADREDFDKAIDAIKAIQAKQPKPEDKPEPKAGQ